jgi:hypothetical protein
MTARMSQAIRILAVLGVAGNGQAIPDGSFWR